MRLICTYVEYGQRSYGIPRDSAKAKKVNSDELERVVEFSELVAFSRVSINIFSVITLNISRNIVRHSRPKFSSNGPRTMSAEMWSSYRGTIPTDAFHPSKCAVTYARITSLYKETAEAFRRRLYLVEVYPFRRICWRRIAMAACGGVGGVHLRPGDRPRG